MTTPVVLHADAETELEEAALWYVEQRTGLGLASVAAADRLLEAIGETPMHFPTWNAPWRRAIVRRFPFVVFYEVKAERVVVMAVAHAHRKPGYRVARRPPRSQP